MLPDRFIGWIRERVATIVAHTLGRTRVTASALTVIGTILMSVAAWLLMNGYFLWAAITITGASIFDVSRYMLNGDTDLFKNNNTQKNTGEPQPVNAYTTLFD